MMFLFLQDCLVFESDTNTPDAHFPHPRRGAGQLERDILGFFADLRLSRYEIKVTHQYGRSRWIMRFNK